MSDDFFEKRTERSAFVTEKNVRIPTDYNSLLRKPEGNPVATSMEFHAMLCALFQALLGIPMNAIDNGAVKKTVHYALRQNQSKGLFGTLLAAYGVIEESRRRALHLHILLWGGLPPRLLQKVAAYPYLWKEVTGVLGTMYKAEISQPHHILRLLHEKQRKNDSDITRRVHAVPASLSKTLHKPTAEGKVMYEKAVNESLSRTNIHEHSFTCHKGPSGKSQCRMAFGKELCEEAKPVEIQFELDTIQEEQKDKVDEEEEEGASIAQEHSINNKDT